MSKRNREEMNANNSAVRWSASTSFQLVEIQDLSLWLENILEHVCVESHQQQQSQSELKILALTATTRRPLLRVKFTGSLTRRVTRVRPTSTTSSET